jgi:hypothetical protein
LRLTALTISIGMCMGMCAMSHVRVEVHGG